LFLKWEELNCHASPDSGFQPQRDNSVLLAQKCITQLSVCQAGIERVFEENFHQFWPIWTRDIAVGLQNGSEKALSIYDLR
jgi:hypothetical protein